MTILMTNSCMKSDDVNGDDLLGEHMSYWVICSCIHKCQVGYLYPMKTIRILCIQCWRLEHFVYNDDDYDTVLYQEATTGTINI